MTASGKVVELSTKRTRKRHKVDADWYALDAHREEWRLVIGCFGFRRRWVCTISHQEDFE